MSARPALATCYSLVWIDDFSKAPSWEAIAPYLAPVFCGPEGRGNICSESKTRPLLEGIRLKYLLVLYGRRKMPTPEMGHLRAEVVIKQETHTGVACPFYSWCTNNVINLVTLSLKGITHFMEVREGRPVEGRRESHSSMTSDPKGEKRRPAMKSRTEDFLAGTRPGSRCTSRCQFDEASQARPWSRESSNRSGRFTSPLHYPARSHHAGARGVEDGR